MAPCVLSQMTISAYNFFCPVFYYYCFCLIQPLLWWTRPCKYFQQGILDALLRGSELGFINSSGDIHSVSWIYMTYVILPCGSVMLLWGNIVGFQGHFLGRFSNLRSGLSGGLHIRGVAQSFIGTPWFPRYSIILLVIRVIGINQQHHNTILFIQIDVLCVGYHVMVRRMCSILSLMWCSDCCAGINPVRFLESPVNMLQNLVMLF